MKDRNRCDSSPLPLGSLCDNPSLRVIPRSRRRRGISHCLENTQSEIPRSARNDSLGRVITQTPKGERAGTRGGFAKQAAATRWSRISSFEFRFSSFDFLPYLPQVLREPLEGALRYVPLVFGLPNHVTFVTVHHELG